MNNVSSIEGGKGLKPYVGKMDSLSTHFVMGKKFIQSFVVLPFTRCKADPALEL